MPDPFFVHLPLQEKKKIGESLYSFQTWPLVCNFICISWCAIITNYWHILMEWVSLAEIFALYHWKKNCIQGYKGFFYHGKFERWKINLTTTVKDSTEFMSYNDFINTKICDLVLLNIEIKVCEKRFAIYIHAIQYSGKKINHRYIEIKIVEKYPLPFLKLNFTQSRKHVILMLSLRDRKLKMNCVLLWRSTATR